MKRFSFGFFGLLFLLFSKLSLAHPAPGNHPSGEWLKDLSALVAMLENLCLPQRDYSDMREIGFFPCEGDDPDLPIECAVSMTGDDEGGGRYLTDLKPIKGINGITLQGVCSGGDHCIKPVTWGTVLLYANSFSNVFYMDGNSIPQRLVACEQN